jgi:hypothetical protein
VKITLFGSLPVMNKRAPCPTSPTPRPCSSSSSSSPTPALVAPDGQFQWKASSFSYGDSRAAGQPSEPASKSGTNELSAEAEEAANKRPIGRPKRDCYDLTIWLWGHLRGTAVMHRGIGTHEGEAVWQGEGEWEECVGDQRLCMQSRLEQPSS